MRTKSLLLSGAAAGVLLALSLNSAAAAADATTTTVKKHHAHAHAKVLAAAPVASAAEVADLKAKLDFLTQRLDEQAAISRDAIAQLKAAQDSADQAKVTAAAAVATAQADQSQILTIPTQVNTAVAAAAPKTDKIYYKGVSITLGGFMEAASIYRSNDETADMGSSFAKIPFANDRAAHTAETRLSGRQSRYSALVQGNVSPTTTAAFYGEFDFLGAAQTANNNESNSYNPRIRNLYGEINWNDSGWHLLAGQNWSLTTMNTKGITPRNELTPPQIDAQYIPGFVWARQPQVRLTKDFDDKQIWVALSAEDAQTTFGNTNAATGVTLTDFQAPTSQFYSGTNYSLNQYPDLVAKVSFDPKLEGHTLHLEAFALGRAFTDRLTYAPTATNQAGLLGIAAGNDTATTYGGGFGAGAVFDVLPKLLDVQGSFMTGSGIGRYGSTQLPDTTARADGRLEGIPETMFLAGATLHPAPQLDLYVFGGQEAEQSKLFTSPALGASAVFGYGTLPGSSNAGCIIEGGTCSAVVKSISQVTGGFWDRFYTGPFGRLQFGVQYSYTQKTAFADSSGLAPKASESMVFTSLRYYPF